MEEIRATLISENYRWGNTVLLSCRGEDEDVITVKTEAEPGEMIVGLHYSLYGHWSNHYKYGRQFLASSFIKVEPHERAGVIAHLRQAPWVGEAVACALWNGYQHAAIDWLRDVPERAAEEIDVKGFTAERAKEAAAYLEGEKKLESATVGLMTIIAQKGFPKRTIKYAIEKWGCRAAEVVRQNPYQLMQFRGCGFLKADALYLELGGNPARLKRQTLCVLNGIRRDACGSTWFDTTFITNQVYAKIGGALPNPRGAVRLGLRAGVLDIHRNGASPWITDAKRSTAEQEVADHAASFLSGPPAWPRTRGLDLSAHQHEQLEKALRGPVAVFAGSPGTGKTYTAARLISKIIDRYGAHQVAVVAPTGKAAVRITEALIDYDIGLKARTIHSYLGVKDAADEMGGGWAFAHNRSNPVAERFVIVDESSMIDTALMASLLKAMRPDGHLLLVGDIQQLPPVGHGAPLRDFLAAGVPSGELREIRRNSGAIVGACAKIRDQEPFSLPRRLDVPGGGNIMLKAARGGAASADLVKRIVAAIRDKGLQDPVWETQVIVAVNENSRLSRKELNKSLQAELNSQNRAKSKFWKDDKVVCLKNSFFPAVEFDLEDDDGFGFAAETSDGPKLYVANGEIGRVLQDYPNRMEVVFSSPRRTVLVPKGNDGETDCFDLGYAISGHKCQGSEWPVVIVALDDYYGAKMVCDRSWLYTAISRAKGVCILVGQESTAKEFCREQKIHGRKTFLVERLYAAGWNPAMVEGGHGVTESSEETAAAI